MKNQKKNSVLLVDDEKDIRDVLRISLADFGYTVHTAENGAEALRVFEEVNPPIVLTDIKMPGMDGIDLLLKLKRENPDIEVIMITGHGDMNLAIRSLKYEAADFIVKPISADALEVALQKVEKKITLKQQLKKYTEHLEALVHEKSELQDHLSTLGLLIGSISHGVKGLLTGLDGGVYILKSGFQKEDKDQIKDGLEVVNLMVERIRKMVLDILFYAKERDLKRECIDVHDFARDLAQVIAPKTEKLKIDFETNFEPLMGEMMVDAVSLHSAVINILENAVDACTRDKAKKIHRIGFAVRRAESRIILEISDNGVGMDRETLNNSHKLFFSLKGNQGTGFGLFISDKIIKQHGGEIEVESRLGQGTRFKVNIPESAPAPGPDEELT
jgi:signal transduction histidine kinase